MYCSKACGVEINLTKFGDSTPFLCYSTKLLFYKMAAYCRSEVTGDVMSGQSAYGVEVVPLTKFDDPNSNRLVTLQNVADGQTDRL